MSERGQPRGFAVIIQEIQGGELHSQLSREFHKVVSETQDYVSDTNVKGKAKLTLDIELELLPNGVCNVLTDIKTKVPRVKLPPSPMWMNKEGNLVAEDPKQAKLFPRDVSRRGSDARDVTINRPEAKEVVQ